ncbi:MAG: type II toxin-antitoxin system RelE/ParE family toxin [Nanoarchaeota archaeon]|nr:type II toxin-antitoxin system RelE/ParE family toxin [Nanoarchaeota archaeon]
MYNISLGSKAEKFLKKTEKEIRLRVWDKIDELKLNPFPSEVVRIVGNNEKAFRVRVGSYRIQYYVFQDKNEIVIFNINKRERAYN